MPHAIGTPLLRVNGLKSLLRGLLICRGEGNGMGALGEPKRRGAPEKATLHVLGGVWGPGHAKRRGAPEGQTPFIPSV